MVLQRVPLSESDGLVGILAVNPKLLDELFKRAVVSKHTQRFLQALPITQFTLSLEAKNIQYDHEQLVVDGRILVRLPHNEDEATFMRTLETTEVWEVSKEEKEKIVEVIGDALSFSGGTAADKLVVEKAWKDTAEDMPLFSRIVGIIRESFLGFSYRKRTSGSIYPFPLFRAPFLSVFDGTKKEALGIVLERLRLRYVAKRDLKEVPAGLVVTPNLDHLRFLFEQQNPEFQEVYRKSFLQTADGYPPLVMFGKASLGHQPKEQVTGIDLFMQLINIIGSESLPYTIYLVGGFGNIPYKTRDYFVSIYPELRNNFVGISTPPMGFLNDKDMVDKIAQDIDQKKPDIIFAGMTVPTQERFVYELMQRKVNFGIGFCIGRAIEMVAGYQKKEPAIVERLHLSWVYRMIFGDRKDIKKRQQNRVLLDFKFVFKTLFSK